MRSDALARRLAIVDAASELFRQYGDKVTLEKIAQQAGVGIATLYRNFPDKQSLKEEVALLMGRKFSEFQVECIEQLESAETTEEQARNIVQAYVEHLLSLNLEVLIPVLVPDFFDDLPDELSDYRSILGQRGETFVDLARSYGAIGPGVTHLELVVGILSLDATKSLDIEQVQPHITRNIIELFLSGLKQGHSSEVPA